MRVNKGFENRFTTLRGFFVSLKIALAGEKTVK